MQGKKREEFRIKLYLLAVGLLVLGMMLTWGEKRIMEPPKEQEEQGEAQNGEEEEQEPALPEAVYNGNIRVLLKTDNFTGECHERVVLSSDGELTARERENGTEWGRGRELAFEREDGEIFLNGEALADVPECLVIEPAEEGGRMALQSLKRGQGTPSYEKRLELWTTEEGFVLINEVPLETYLQYVIPSEMPSSYQAEALKAQAVCARTYAYKQMQSYAYPAYEAHVDDSVRYQVYNNTDRADSTDEAALATADLILTSGGVPITAYYFSTSCGHTGNEEIWWEGSKEQTPYLAGKTVNAEGKKLDLTDEETFAEFLEKEDESCYDADVSWYRWRTEMDVETLSEHLNGELKSRYEANPEAILTKRGDAYESLPTEHIGTIEKLEVLERGEGGTIQRLRVVGSEETIEVETEYNVRALLHAQGNTIIRGDGSPAEGGAILPSACMTITPAYDEEGKLTAYEFYGGGYGHGVGMSQNGANGMAREGKSCEEILRFFYTDVELTAIGSL